MSPVVQFVSKTRETGVVIETANKRPLSQNETGRFNKRYGGRLLNRPIWGTLFDHPLCLHAVFIEPNDIPINVIAVEQARLSIRVSQILSCLRMAEAAINNFSLRIQD